MSPSQLSTAEPDNSPFVLKPLPIQFQPAPSFVSPDTRSHQGYSTDGVRHYTVQTGVIYRWASDWTPDGAQRKPFDELTGYNHLGDSDLVGQSLYVPAERWNGCDDYSNQSIFVFDSMTFERLAVANISAQGHEASGVAIDRGGQRLFVSSFCDPNGIFVYQLNTFAYLGRINLRSPIPRIQGLAYSGGFLYASEDGTTATSKYLCAVDVESGTVYRLMNPRLGSGAYEGIDLSQGELRWLIDLGSGNQRVYYFPALSGPR
jgi:hypothetical protein